MTLGERLVGVLLVLLFLNGLLSSTHEAQVGKRVVASLQSK